MDLWWFGEFQEVARKSTSGVDSSLRFSARGLIGWSECGPLVSYEAGIALCYFQTSLNVPRKL
jgi:hypothetical protein